MRKIFALVATGALALTMSNCGRASTADAGKDSIAGGTKGTIGVAMPTKTSQRWIKDGDAMKAQLEAAGYKVNLQYANDDIPTQVTQVNDMVTKKNQVLVVASIDGTALAGALKQAKEANIPVIAYDRLLRSTDAVDYYTTFDNLKVGELQAQSLIKGLEASGKAGSVERRAVRRLPGRQQRHVLLQRRHEGPAADDRLRARSRSPRVRPTSRPSPRCAGTPASPRSAWRTCSPSPTPTRTSRACSRRTTASPAASSRPSRATATAAGGKKLPVITGQDAEIESVKSILAGEQYSSVFKDTSKLAETTVNMIKQIAEKKTVTVNDTTSYNNGVKNVPTMLLQPVAIDKANVKQILLDAKYYTAAEMG